MGDTEVVEKIGEADKPAKTKQLGREVRDDMSKRVITPSSSRKTN